LTVMVACWMLWYSYLDLCTWWEF